MPRLPAGGDTADAPMHAVTYPDAEEKPLELDTVSSRWQRALDTSHAALGAAPTAFSADELKRRQAGLRDERQGTDAALRRLAHTALVPAEPWIAPLPVTHDLLGLAPEVEGCIFDLEGVLTDSGALHAAVWARVFDDFLQQQAERAQRAYIPFDPDTDYRRYVEGRPRLEGIHTFLESRGLRVPEGSRDDPAGAPTANGFARRKQELLARGIHERGVAAIPGARRYLEAAGHAGLPRVVVAASTSTSWMLELAGLTPVVEARVDAETIREEQLRSRPAPDLLLSACRKLGVRPERSVTFTHLSAGVDAGRTVGIDVVPIDVADGHPSLRGLLAPVLRDA
jgi:beta-phosphoglucomutase-like phosphatase (HAD superfamily)